MIDEKLVGKCTNALWRQLMQMLKEHNEEKVDHELASSVVLSLASAYITFTVQTVSGSSKKTFAKTIAHHLMLLQFDVMEAAFPERKEGIDAHRKALSKAYGEVASAFATIDGGN
jgi:uncharacterized protein with ATP-grasp and redox domains